MHKFFSIHTEKQKLIIRMFGIKISFKKHICGKNNKIYISKNGKLFEHRGKIPGLDINICGNDNQVVIGYPYRFLSSSIVCNGDNNSVIIEETNASITCFFDLSHPMSNRKVHIKKNAQIGRAQMHLWTSNSSIIVGENCLFSWGIELMTGDGHKITKKGESAPINSGSYCEIGNHVWLGQQALICKNVKVPDNSVVGACSVVTKSFDSANIAIAGNPAKVVKEGIDWDKEINF